jgi:hypothetical protein
MVKDNDHENVETLQNTSKGPMKIQKSFVWTLVVKCIVNYVS